MENRIIDNRINEREFERGYSENSITKKTTSVSKYNCCNKLNVFNWLKDITFSSSKARYVEVRFKNTRKGYYDNSDNISLEIGDIVAVEASPGHDIGIVSLTGDLVLLQMKKNNINRKSDLKKVYRKARQADIEKWKDAISKELQTMLKTREIARNLGLEMKIGDVEYQGDNTKAIFYYIAEERIDFRELIKVMADEFKIRIEMKQIGARQEAGRIGGIGPCGRELCCTTWISNFISVSTNSARFQELSLNPQKLAGQCSKLKCCLNYELSIYIDARKQFPKNYVNLQTTQGEAKHIKNDVFQQLMYYEVNINQVNVVRAIPVQKAIQFIEKNQKGIIVDNIFEDTNQNNKNEKANINNFSEELNSDSITRFSETKKKKKKKKKRNKNEKK